MAKSPSIGGSGTHKSDEGNLKSENDNELQKVGWTEETPSSLSILGIPFAYAMASLLSLYIVAPKDVELLERLGLVALVGSLIAAVVVAYRPVDRHLLPFLVKKYFNGRWLYSMQTTKEVPESIAGGEINFLAYAQMSLDSKSMDRPKGEIRSIIFLTILLILTSFAFVDPLTPNLLTLNFALDVRAIVATLLVVACALLLLPLRDEIRKLPMKLYLQNLYLLGAQGAIAFGSNFNKLEEALHRNDWPSAQFWAHRWFLEGKFFPQWPSRTEAVELMLGGNWDVDWVRAEMLADKQAIREIDETRRPKESKSGS